MRVRKRLLLSISKRVEEKREPRHLPLGLGTRPLPTQAACQEMLGRWNVERRWWGRVERWKSQLLEPG